MIEAWPSSPATPAYFIISCLSYDHEEAYDVIPNPAAS
jgi:hypothetical protein